MSLMNYFIFLCTHHLSTFAVCLIMCKHRVIAHEIKRIPATKPLLPAKTNELLFKCPVGT